MSTVEYDLVGIGIGPFNLGLAALARSLPGLRTRFFERRPAFSWHEGIMIEGTTLQVSYLADLVTLVDPSSPFTYLAYLKQIGRLYQFAIRDSSYISRREYNAYCQWVASQLPSLTFGADVTSVQAEDGGYAIEVRTAAGVERIRARHVVIGVGTTPSLPAFVRGAPGLVMHSSQYLEHRDSALGQGSIALVGSGQSAGEIFHDLLERKRDATQLTWLTRSPRFFPMDYSKLAVEMAAPDYIDHFYQLAPAIKASVLAGQDSLYKGINLSLIDQIYDALYERTIDGPRNDVHLVASCELEAVGTGDGAAMGLRFVQRELAQRFELAADVLVLATGYAYRLPACLEPLRERLALDGDGRPVISRDYELVSELGGLFAQNAELHSHGFTAPDLSLGPYRNATILNAVLGEERFPLERRIAFQDFGVPPHARVVEAGDDVAGKPTWPATGLEPVRRARPGTERAEDW
jgi:lysine N6-hydroxylase